LSLPHLPSLLTGGPVGVGVGTLLSVQDVELGRTMVDMVEGVESGVLVLSAGMVAEKLLDGELLSLEIEAGLEERLGVAEEATLGV
jgi:hypothetical protein